MLFLSVGLYNIG